MIATIITMFLYIAAKEYLHYIQINILLEKLIRKNEPNIQVPAAPIVDSESMTDELEYQIEQDRKKIRNEDE